MRRKTRSTGGRLHAAPTTRPCNENKAAKAFLMSTDIKRLETLKLELRGSLLNPAVLLTPPEGHRAIRDSNRNDMTECLQ
jgi:hypothetical protein